MLFVNSLRRNKRKNCKNDQQNKIFIGIRAY